MIADSQKDRDRRVIESVLKNTRGKPEMKTLLALSENYPYGPKDREGREWWISEVRRQRGEEVQE